MEIIMLIMAAAYAVGSKNHKDTATAAYKAGKEPPGLEKARMRHEAGGGRFVTRPGKDKQTPKGPGATRLLVAQQWANGCEKARTRSEDSLRRWQAWYQEQAPQRDQNWRAKQLRKINNRAERLAKWQGRWVSAKNTLTGTGGQDSTGEHTGSEPEPAASTDETQPKDQAAQSEQAVEDTATATGSARTDDTEPAPQPEQGHHTSTGPGGGSTAVRSGTAPIGDLVDYQQAAATLHNHADEVDGYTDALTGLGQDMEAAGWGAEVHGDLVDMHRTLSSVADRYRDLAETVTSQGNAVNDAYDEAPWAPDKAALAR